MRRYVRFCRKKILGRAGQASLLDVAADLGRVGDSLDGDVEGGVSQRGAFVLRLGEHLRRSPSVIRFLSSSLTWSSSHRNCWMFWTHSK